MQGVPINRAQGGSPYAYYLTAAQPNCGYCGQAPFPHTPIYCVGAPYFMLLHQQCLPLFDYEDHKWPHNFPLVSFTKPRSNAQP